MLYRVGYIGVSAIDSNVGQQIVQQSACGPDEGPSRKVLLISWSFANEHQSGIGGTLAEDRLRGASK